MPPPRREAADPCRAGAPVAGQKVQLVGRAGYLYASRLVSPKGWRRGWAVPVLEQVGPESWEIGKRTVPHKTPVKVIEDIDSRWRAGNTGKIRVELADGTREVVGAADFTTQAYWDCPIRNGGDGTSTWWDPRHGPFIASVNEGAEILDAEKRWVSLRPGMHVLCDVPGEGLGARWRVSCRELDKNDETRRHITVEPKNLSVVY